MTAAISLSDKCGRDWGRTGFIRFLQQMANRAAVGALRYGCVPDAERNYMSRLAKELAAYRRNGNREHLLNIAVYAWLEGEAPENRKYHFDASAASVTRDGG
jgi:hypothetical protein